MATSTVFCRCRNAANNSKSLFRTAAAKIHQTRYYHSSASLLLQMQSKFGIVAAQSLNGVIGVRGKLPWPPCPEDRKNFVNLTQNGILIVGRKTFEEESDLSHVCHANVCLVVSRTMKEGAIRKQQSCPTISIKVASSLSEALEMAQEFILQQENNDDDRMSCWVAGGQRLYEEALQHEGAQELHLTTIHIHVDIDDENDVAMFPPNHLWEHKFHKVSRVNSHQSASSSAGDDANNSPTFTYVKYVRTR